MSTIPSTNKYYTIIESPKFRHYIVRTKKPPVIKMNTQTKITEYASNEGRADELDTMAQFHEECAAFGNSLLFRYDYVFRCYVRKEGF